MRPRGWIINVNKRGGGEREGGCNPLFSDVSQMLNKCIETRPEETRTDQMRRDRETRAKQRGCVKATNTRTTHREVMGCFL